MHYATCSIEILNAATGTIDILNDATSTITNNLFDAYGLFKYLKMKFA